jgi:hypothetical protein
MSNSFPKSPAVLRALTLSPQTVVRPRRQHLSLSTAGATTTWTKSVSATIRRPTTTDIVPLPQLLSLSTTGAPKPLTTRTTMSAREISNGEQNWHFSKLELEEWLRKALSKVTLKRPQVLTFLYARQYLRITRLENVLGSLCFWLGMAKSVNGLDLALLLNDNFPHP